MERKTVAVGKSSQVVSIGFDKEQKILEIEFSSGVRIGEGSGAADSQPEIYATDEGLVSLRELAEEELLLALPLVAVCSTPQTCGRAPAYEAGEARTGESNDRTRPFTALRDLLKKT